MSKFNHQSHQEQINSLLTQIRHVASSSDDQPGAQALRSILAVLQEEEERGSLSRPGTAWLDDRKNGHTWLAQAQARMFVEYVPQEGITFDLAESSWPDVSALAFYQALKRFIDAPHVTQIYERFGTRAATAARRASHVFAREVICSTSYDTVARKANLPPAPLDEDRAHKSFSRWKSLRHQAFENWIALEISRLRERGMSYGRIGDELDISGTTASIHDTYSQRNGTPRDETPPSAPQSHQEPVRQLNDGRWLFPLGDGATAIIPEERLVALVREHWRPSITTGDH